MKKQVKKFMTTLLACVMVAVSVISFDMNPVHAASASGTITEASGWFETAYVKWTPISGATGYNVYIKSASASDVAYAQLDDELIRQYPSYMRADAVGLKAGDYVMKIVPLNDGKENTSGAIVTEKLTVAAYDRSGFTFASGSPAANGVGAYNNDGTLKSGASVLYVTEANKKTVKMTIKGTEYTGVAAITQAIKTKNSCQPVAIRIIGQVTLDGLACSDVSSAYAIGVKGAENVTIEGVGDDATLYTAGVAVFQSNSVEIRNLGLMNWGGGSDGDGISLKASVGVWVHNNDIFYGNAGSDGDQAKGDGSMDLKDNSQYVTISYNHFWDSGKMSLCGMKSESGENWITYHHNWFDHSDSRHPRIRTMSVHVYNNYYDGNSKYGVGAAKDSEAFVEANYFRNCTYPMLSSMQGSDVLADGIFSGENGGIIKAYNNYMEGQKSVIYANSDAGTTSASSTDFDAYLAATRNETVPSTYKAKQGGSTYSNFDTKVDLGVDPSNIDNPKDVPSIVTANAGRMNGGDFEWTFDNSVDDASSSLNKELKTALNSYKTTLVSVGGGSTSGTSHTHTYGDWVVEKEATETEEGLKSRTCTVCGDKEEQVIPKKSSSGTEEPETPVVTDGQVHNFTTDGKTSSFYTITGNLSTSKGTVTYNGLTLTQCLKMEDSTSITFTASAKGKLTLVFGGASGKKVKINGTATTIGSDSILTVDVAAGNVEVTKKDSINLFYVVYTPESTSHTHSYTSKVTKEATCTEAGELTYTCSCGDTYTEAIKATGHNYSTEWTVDVEPTETAPGSKSHHCTVCGDKADVTAIPATGVVKKNGLDKAEDGNYYYYVDDAVDTSFTGFADYETDRMYVKNGKVDDTYTDIIPDGEYWVYVEDGRVRYDYTGIRQNANGWWRIENGKVNFEFTGLADNENGRFYIENGMVDFGHTDVMQDESDWVYVEGGLVRYDYTGIRQNANGWWRIENGKVNFEFTGLADNENGRFYIENGMVDFGHTDVMQDGSDWVYVEGGHVRYDYTGIRQNANGWWRIEEGKVNFKFTGLADNENGRFYIENGMVDFGYTDVMQDGSDWVYVENGHVRYDYTGIRQNANGWWRIEEGKVNFNFTGIASNENGMFYIENGLVRFDYTGTYVQDDIAYNVVGGVVVNM